MKRREKKGRLACYPPPTTPPLPTAAVCWAESRPLALAAAPRGGGPAPAAAVELAVRANEPPQEEVLLR